MEQEFDQSKTLFLPFGAAIDLRAGVATRSSKIWRRSRFGVVPKISEGPRMFRKNVDSLIGRSYFLYTFCLEQYSDY